MTDATLPTDENVAPPEPDAPEAAEPTGPRVFTLTEIGWITAFGGPLAGGFSMAYNARQFGHVREATYALLGGIVATALLLGLLFQLPEAVTSHSFYPIAMGIAWALIVLVIADKTQGGRIKAHIADGGRSGSGWVGVGMVALGMVVLLTIGALLALATPLFEGTAYERAGGGTVYASGAATETDARYVGTELGRFGYFPDGYAAQVTRGADGVSVSMLLIPETETDTLFLLEIHALAQRLRSALEAPVAIVNVVDDFSGRRETVLTDVLSPEERLRLNTPTPEPSPAPPPPPTP